MISLAGRVHALDLLGVAPVEGDQRVQVAVAGVEDVHDDQVVLGRDPLDALEHLDQAGARHHAVVQVVVRGDPRHRAEGALARLPEQRRLGGVARHPHPARPVRGADGLDDRRVRAATSAGVPSTSTSSTAAASTGRSAWTNARRPIVMRWSIISIAAGITPAAMMPPTASPAARTVGKSSSIVRTSAGVRIRRTVHLGHHAERALAAHDEPAQVVAGRVGRRAAQAQHLAVAEHDLHARARAGR